MSALDRAAEEIRPSRTPSPAPAIATTNSEDETTITNERDAIAISNRPSDLLAALLLAPSPGSLRTYRPFPAIPPFSRLGNVKAKPDILCLEGVDTQTESSKAISGTEMLSKDQLPISQWPLFTSYEASVTANKPTIPASGNLDETARLAKQEHVLDYVYDWAAWAAEIPDPCRRSEVLEFVMRTLERVLKSGMESSQMVLGPGDVKGTRSKTQSVWEGEVNINVTITSILKEKPDGERAVRKAKSNLAEDQPAEIGAAAALLSKPAPELPMSIEEASNVPPGKGKRAANEMEGSDKVQEIKRQKTADINADPEEKADTRSPTDGQSQEQLDGQGTFSAESMTSMSPAEEEKRAHYREQIFRSRLNQILKKAGKAQTRGKCTKWATVKTKLKDAGVRVRWRNLMLNDFYTGYEAWNGNSNIDPNEELVRFAHYGFEESSTDVLADSAKITNAEAAEGAINSGSSDTATLISPLETLPVLNTDSPIPDAFVPAPPPKQPTHPSDPPEAAQDPTAPKKLIVTLRTFSSFDPEDYSVYNVYQHENFMFTFKPTSTVKERVAITEPLRKQIDKKLNAVIVVVSDGGGNDGNDIINRSQMLDCERLFIRNGRSKIVATGNFVDFNSEYMVLKGWADREKPWLWQGTKLTVDPVYGPRTWTHRLKQAGESLAVKAGE